MKSIMTELDNEVVVLSFICSLFMAICGVIIFYHMSNDPLPSIVLGVLLTAGLFCGFGAIYQSLAEILKRLETSNSELEKILKAIKAAKEPS